MSVEESTSSVRKFCVRSYVTAILRVKRTNPRKAVTNARVMQFMNKLLLTYNVLISGLPALRGTEFSKDGVYNLMEWMKNMNKHGFYFGGVTETYLKKKKGYSMRLRLRCIEHRRSSSCQATVVMSRRRSSGLWDISCYGSHSHDQLEEYQSSKRNASLFLYLKIFSIGN